jgi:lipid-binding SYLF domain-containing protein
MAKAFTWVFLGFVALGLSACAKNIPLKSEAEALVDQARWTVEMFKERNDEPDQAFRAALKDASGIVIFPGAVKGAFIVGAEGGNGVLVARDDTGVWGYPAFYTLGAGSFGLQVGAQSSEIVLVLRTQKALQAIINNQGKLGGNIQMTMGQVGAGIEAATTTNVGADIVGFAHGAGVYAGASLEGAVLARRNDLNQAYYGNGATPQTSVFDRRFVNPQADPLRLSLAVN